MASRLPSLSVVILAKNEAARIARCLESVAWVRDRIVIDGMSEDGTPDICERAGARVIRRLFSGSFAEERNAGMAAAREAWVLQIDADDIVTPAFRAAVETLLAAGTPHQAFKFRRKSYLLGRFMAHGGWYHYLPNLVRREVRYEGAVHERPALTGSIGQLDADIEHHACQDLKTFVDRHNRYTSLSAQELKAQRGVQPAAALCWQLARRSWKTFWKSYVKKQGHREGLHGLVFALFFAWVEALKWAKYWELCHARPALTAFIAQQNRNTSAQAQRLAAMFGPRRLGELRFQLGLRPGLVFCARYLRPGEGRRGAPRFIYAILQSFMHALLWAKYWEQVVIRPAEAPAGATLQEGAVSWEELHAPQRSTAA